MCIDRGAAPKGYPMPASIEYELLLKANENESNQKNKTIFSTNKKKQFLLHALLCARMKFVVFMAIAVEKA